MIYYQKMGPYSTKEAAQKDARAQGKGRAKVTKTKEGWMVAFIYKKPNPGWIKAKAIRLRRDGGIDIRK